MKHCRHPHGRDAKRVEAAVVSRGAIVPFSPTKNTFFQWLGTSNVNSLLLQTQTCAHTRKYQLAHLLSLYAPTPLHRGAWQCPRCMIDMVQGGVLHHEQSNILHALRFGSMKCGPPPRWNIQVSQRTAFMLTARPLGTEDRTTLAATFKGECGRPGAAKSNFVYSQQKVQDAVIQRLGQEHGSDWLCSGVHQL